MKMLLRFASITLFASAILFACSKNDNNTNDSKTLYDRLGGVSAISAVVDKFLSNVVADNTINARFAPTVSDPYRTQLLRNNLIDQICAGSGGPCQYKGKTMLAAHTGMNITTEEFNALVGDLVAAMNSLSVPQTEQTDLLAILGPMQSDIIGK